MIVIIPALIKTAECENALRATIRGIPNDLVRKIVVVSQGRQPRLEHVSTPQIDIVHVPTAIGKWPAIQLGCRKLPEQSMVLLLDADDAFDHSSLADFLKRARSSNYESVAGKRDEILLHSENSGVPTSRPFLEIFSNTLAMQSIGYVSSYLWDMPPDIQVGLRLIRSNHLLESKVERSQFYGG